MKRILLTITLAVLAVLALSGSAQASTFTGTTTDFGSVYTLTVNCNSSNTLCDVILQIDTTNYVAPKSGANFISAVDFKISNTISSIASLTPPSGSWSNQFNVGINNSGCASGGNGFGCSQANNTASFAAVGGVLTWTWTGVSIPGLNVTDVHIGAKYNNSAGDLNGVITSNTVTLTEIPEPGTLTLLGTGLLSLAGLVRRRLAA